MTRPLRVDTIYDTEDASDGRSRSGSCLRARTGQLA